MKNKTALHSLGHAAAVLAYTSCVAWIMFNSEHLFDGKESPWLGVMMLMLFVLSAAIVGTLILGKPVMLYIDGHKKEAVTFLGYTLAWLFLITLTVWMTQLLRI